MNPHTMTYEVLEITSSTMAKTVFTSESFYDCLEPFDTILNRDGIARTDIVVRETESGKPLSRVTIVEIETTEHMNNREAVYLHGNDYGSLGPCVFCKDYENKPWLGYEHYSWPVNV